MDNVLQKFQSDCLLMSPELLMPLGLVATALGICIWLGGLRWHWLAGAAMAGAVAYIAAAMINVDVQVLAFAVVIAASVGLFLGKPIQILAAGLLLAFLSLWICTIATNTGGSGDFSEFFANVISERLDMNQSLELFHNWLQNMMLSAASAFAQTPLMLKFAAGVIAVITLGAGFIFRQIVGAIGCSLFGTGTIFFGMITLLLYKGSQPLTTIYNNATFYTAVAACMIVLGSVAGFLLCCEQPKINEKENKKSDKTKEASKK